MGNFLPKLTEPFQFLELCFLYFKGLQNHCERGENFLVKPAGKLCNFFFLGNFKKHSGFVFDISRRELLFHYWSRIIMTIYDSDHNINIK